MAVPGLVEILQADARRWPGSRPARRGWIGCARGNFRQAEVENLGVSALGDENVGGLDVAMDDAFAVRGVERVGDFDGQAEQDVHFQRTAGDAVLEGHAIQILHGDEGLAVLLADVVDGADVGMIERGSGPGFAPKALQGLADPGRRPRAEISGRRSGRGECLRPCKPRPCRRRRAFRRCGSARWFGRSFWLIITTGTPAPHLRRMPGASQREGPCGSWRILDPPAVFFASFADPLRTLRY